MDNKRAQGLPFNTIVLALIALFVLIVIIVYATGAFGKIFSSAKTIQDIAQADIASAQTKCSQYCMAAQNSKDLSKTAFCLETLPITDSETGETTQKKCYESPINQGCTITVEGVEQTESDCPQ